MRLFWKNGEQVMVTEGVPDGAVPFAIGAPCPCGGGFISHIIRQPAAYACMTSDRREKHRHVGLPKLTYRQEGDVLVVTDNEIGASSHFEWKPYRSGSAPSSE